MPSRLDEAAKSLLPKSRSPSNHPSDSRFQGGIGFDNPRENIDPHIKTKVLSARELDVPGTNPKSESYTGANCTGTDGDASRALTLANTKISSQEMVVVDKFILEKTQDYTISHNAASTVITFLAKIWDTQRIVVRYFV